MNTTGTARSSARSTTTDTPGTTEVDEYSVYISAAYADVLAELEQLNFAAKISSRHRAIRIELGRAPALGGVPICMLLSNGDGLLTRAERSDFAEDGTERWVAGLYESEPGDHLRELEIFCDAEDITQACDLAWSLSQDAVRVAVTRVGDLHDWETVGCPVSALGDKEAEQRWISSQLRARFGPSGGSYDLDAVIVLDPAEGWTIGCATHSGYPSGQEREAASAGHRHCAHELASLATAA